MCNASSGFSLSVSAQTSSIDTLFGWIGAGLQARGWRLAGSTSCGGFAGEFSSHEYVVAPNGRVVGVSVSTFSNVSNMSVDIGLMPMSEGFQVNPADLDPACTSSFLSS